ncbi:molybdopterin-dependent oxidoreductase [Martelella sp. HB161492]|uniref:molybdopterin-dependent oxidoreductase n=1 Tax=Martelella sp. HB161492 TaxID=2720726 RepID=UPI001590E395|nr:molybdopterin-dependent oxidoreductase [Martelella sp. HB161492]
MLITPDRATVATHWGTYLYETGDERLKPHPIDPDPSPIGFDMLAAARHPVRIARPSVRRSYLERGADAGGDGRGREDYVEVSWDEALDLAASAYRQVISERGNEAIYGGSYGWGSAGRFHHAQSQLHRFLNCVGGYTSSVGTYSHGAGSTLLPHVIGSSDGLSGRHTSWERIAENADLVVMFGGTPWKNSQVNAGGVARHSLSTHLSRFAERGVSAINISPIRDDVPLGTRAEWLPIRPGSDVALMLALAFVLDEEGLTDTSFLQSHTAGFDVFAGYLRGSDDGQPKTPEWAAPLCDIPPDEIRPLARRMAKGRTFLMMAWSLQRAEYGEQPFWMLVTLAAMLGQIGLPGGGFGFGYGAVDGTGREAPIRWPSFPQGINPVKSFIPVARIADMLLHPGESYDFNGEQRRYPEIELIHWAGGNPFHHHQDLGRLTRAWRRPSTIIVQDHVWTATARMADIVFPVVMQVERDDISCSSRDAILTPSHRILEPYAGARSNYAILCGLADRLDAGQKFSEGLAEEGWIRRLYDQARRRLADIGREIPDFESFWAGGPLEIPGGDAGDLLGAFRDDPAANPLRTPTGRIEIASETIAAFRYEDCPGHPTWFEPESWSEPGLALISNQPNRKLHSQLEFGSYAQQGRPGGCEPARIHPDDGAALGIADGATIKLSTTRGSCIARAVYSENLRRGVIQLSTGAWFAPENPDDAQPHCLAGNVNAVTRDKGTSRLAQGSVAQSCRVTVTPCEGTLRRLDVYTQAPVTRPRSATDS